MPVSAVFGPYECVLRASTRVRKSAGWWRVGRYAGFRFGGSLICDDATAPGLTCDFGSHRFRSFPVSSGHAED
jgi:hypothetical protein